MLPVTLMYVRGTLKALNVTDWGGCPVLDFGGVLVRVVVIDHGADRDCLGVVGRR